MWFTAFDCQSSSTRGSSGRKLWLSSRDPLRWCSRDVLWVRADASADLCTRSTQMPRSPLPGGLTACPMHKLLMTPVVVVISWTPGSRFHVHGSYCRCVFVLAFRPIIPNRSSIQRTALSESTAGNSYTLRKRSRSHQHLMMLFLRSSPDPGQPGCK